MAKMKSDALLDYAVFQLSPKRLRCELFVSADERMEKVASGLLKPFVSHLQIAEEQVASASQSISLKVGGYKNAETWFTKGTLERFVRFVSTPEVLEQVNTFDADMSQLEAARRIYLQGAGDRLSGGGVPRVTAGDDATKKELLRAIDLGLAAVQQDLSTAFARAAAAGFNIDTVSQLKMFADTFGAHRLNEACAQFISLNERRPEFIRTWKSRLNNQAVRSSYGSDMSVDDDPPSPPPCVQPTRCQEPDPKGPNLSRESSVEWKPTNSITGQDSLKHDQSGSVELCQPARQLSVQDRINMFENKKKENSGGKPVVVKPVELRRVSSDLLSGGAAEKAVLRRWSGASDMSIDLSADKKDAESPLCTPVSTVVSQDKNISNSNDSTPDISSLAKLEISIIFSSDRGNDNILKRVSLSDPEQPLEARKSSPNLDSGGSDVLKDQVGDVTQSRSSVGMLDGRECPEDSFITSATGKIEGLDGFGNQGKLKGPRLGEETWMSGVKNPVSFPTHIKFFVGKGGEQIETANRREGSESRDGFVNEIRVKATQMTAMESEVTEGDPGSRIAEAFASRYKGIVRDPSPSMKEVISIGELDIAEKKESRMSEKLSGKTVSSFEDCGPQRLKFDRQGLTAEPNNMAQVQRDKICSSGSIGTQFSGQVEAHEVDYFSTPPSEQAQKIRPSKGKHELNNELKLKASELEKFFAEHKLRVPGEQSNTARKGRSGDTQREAASSLHYTKPVADTALDNDQFSEPRFSKNSTKFDASSPMKAIGGDAMNKKFSDLSVSKGSRGKFYDSYMQIRDANLREDWSAKREEKEARLKSLQDSLERNRSEMKAKISGSADRQDSVSNADRRAERIRSYHSRSIMKLEQQQLNFGDSEYDDEALGFPEPNRFHENKALDDISTRDGVSRGVHLKKNLPNNRKFSSTPRTSAAPVPKPATKVSAISSGKRRMLPVNPLAQSVPNLSDMRNENTKPSSGANKPTRSRVRSLARRQSTSNEAAIVRDDKSHRSQSLRKSSANPGDFREASPVDSDGAYLTPIKLKKEILENAVSKSFLKKGSLTSFVSQKTSARERASGVPELISKKVVNCDTDCGPDEFFSVVNDEDEEELESLNNEDQNVLNHGEPKQMLEQDELVNSGSENGDGTLTFSLVDQALGSTLHVKSLPDWSGGSPVSWNSHTQQPFSYAHEMSDVDASVDSPVGSPASWNSHSLKQVETDSARMRKTWGMAQKPTMAVHSSNNQSHKDMTRGFKRLLKFGRKSHGSESVVDSISAVTSEGDDDTEDGKDPAHRLSDDLRKSRMGFSHAQASEDSFNERKFFCPSVESSLQSSIPAPPANFKLREDHMSGSSIKAPRSFFSLSSFRSKGSSESKLR